jgi:hypothetical protein
MRYGGIQAGIVGWSGRGSISDRAVPTLLRAARGTSFHWTLQVRGVGGSTPNARSRARARAIVLILARYGDEPAYLEIDGRSVVFVANAGGSCAGAARWVRANAGRAYLVLPVVPGSRRCNLQPDAWYENDPALAEASQLPWSFTISPGLFPATRSAAILSRDLARWRAQVSRLAASPVTFHLVSSFNAWGAGTAVAGAREWSSPSGFGAYLDVLHDASPAEATAAAAATAAARGASGDPVVAAAGDIACDPADSAFAGGAGDAYRCQMRETSDLLATLPTLAAVLTLGDSQYEDNSYAAFMQSFDPTWGRFRALIHPATGNHEYLSHGAGGYFQYFGAAAGDPARGYYSFDVGSWHLIALNSNCSQVAGCEAGSPQETWLRADLAAHPAACTLAYWHHPRFSSGRHGGTPATQPLWQALQEAGADLVLSGHDHDYERFAPQSADGVPDAARGIREFVVGTGGKNHGGFYAIAPNSEVRDDHTYGVFALTLHPTGYDWRFVPTPGSVFVDVGGGVCHGRSGPAAGAPATPAAPAAPPAAVDRTPPSAPAKLVATVGAPDAIDLAWSPASDAVGVTAYTIYRNGVAAGSTAGAVLRLTDSGLPPATVATYTVDAVDAAGNHSGRSPAASAVTPG